MNPIRSKVIEAAQSRIGLPFKNHFKPDNKCNYGSETLPTCMIKGMNNDGYDCSGLVISIICEAVRVDYLKWPMRFRHMNQLKKLEENIPAQIGDVLLFYQKEKSRTHMGLLVAERSVIHASGITKVVEQGVVEGSIARIGVIPLDRILRLSHSI